MELERVALASAEIAATSKRSEKVAVLATLLGEVDAGEMATVIGLLIGEIRQGRIGVGWSMVSAVAASPAESASLTVDDVDRLLTSLASTTGPGSRSIRLEALEDVFGRATGIEQSFLRRVLVGEVRQGALAGVVTDAVARAHGVPLALMRRAAMLEGDLGRAATIVARAGRVGLEAIGLEVGRGVEPMLAATAADVDEALAGFDHALVEWKLDGARIQVHRSGHDVRIFTRNLNDVTARLSRVVEIVRDFDIDRLVLDGEVMGVRTDGRPQPFQDTMSSLGSDEGDPAAPALAPFFFDVLHHDGVDLLDTPLRDRHRLLHDLVGTHRIPAITVSGHDGLRLAEEHLAAAMGAGHEGVMVKDLASSYEAGRRGKSWRKVKPVHTLDLVVLAAEWGHGRRAGWLSNLHLGARDPEAGGFVMVGKTFKGLTDEILTWQTAALLAREERRSSTGHTVHVRPELVVEIALDGVQSSSRYPGGVALRFARVRGYRPDREPASADTIDTVRALLP